MKKLGIAAASVILGASIAFAASVPAYAAEKVDCDAVMQALGTGKHAKDVAADMKISSYQVRKCKQHALAAAKAETKNLGTRGAAAASAAIMASPAPSAAAPSKK